METFAEPDLLADAKRQGYVIDPISGPDMKKLVDELAATPKAIVDQVAAFIDPAGSR